MSVYRPKNRDGSYKTAHYHYDFIIRVNGESLRFHGPTFKATEREARAFEEAEKARLRSAGPNDDMTLATACLRYIQEKGTGLASVDDLETAFEHICRLIGSSRRLINITSDDIAKAVRSRQAETVGKTGKRLVAAGTVNRQITEPLKRLLRRASKVWKVNVFPERIDWNELHLKEPAVRVRELSTDEGNAFWSNIRDDYRPLVVFLAIRGFRVRSALAIGKFDVDHQRRTVAAWKKGVGKVTYSLTPQQCAIIKEEAAKAPESPTVWTYVLQRKRGGKAKGERAPITYSGLRKVISNALEDAGIKDFRIHDLRHDFASKLLRHCRDITIVQKALGHSDIASTTRYAHVLEETVGDAMSSMPVPETSRSRREGGGT